MVEQPAGVTALEMVPGRRTGLSAGMDLGVAAPALRDCLAQGQHFQSLRKEENSPLLKS